MIESKAAARLLFGAAALAAAGFGVVTASVLRGKTSRLDKSAKRRIQVARSPAWREAAKATGPFGKWYAHLPAALATATQLRNRGSTRGAVAVVATSVGAALLSRALDHAVKQRRPPPERGEPWTQSYPSGHALESSALALTTGYVLWREGLAPAWTVAPLGASTLAAGAGRLLLDRHWTSDVVGGYCAGLAFGAACAGLFELSRERAARA